jgi:hypothetical protein
VGGVGAPFVVYALPRSRTAWLARFLSYGGWTCHHEVAIQMRSIGDVVELFRQPRTGTAETGITPGWRLLHHLVPGIRAVVIRRPVDDVVEAMLAVDIGGVGQYDRALLRRNMEYMNRCLERIAVESDALVVDYADLDRAKTCSAIFRHCLPFEFDAAWWERLRTQNIQADVKAVMRYYFDNRDAIEHFKATCKAEMRRLARAGAISNRVEA